LIFNGHPAHARLIVIPLGVIVRNARFMGKKVGLKIKAQI